MAACENFEQVLSLLELDSYFPSKINLRDVFEANLNKRLELKDIKWKILNKIITVDLRARDDVLSHILESISEQAGPMTEEIKTKGSNRRKRHQRQLSIFHPQDVLNALFLCCSPFLKQLVVSKLLICRIAVPFIISSSSKHRAEGFLWPFNFVETDGTYSTGKCIEGYLSDQDIQIVSFIRINKTCFSKSDLLNHVLSKDPFFQTFYSKNCPLGTNSRRTLAGTVEATHFVPFGRKTSDSFDNLILFLNLRGDAMQYPLLVDVIKSVSNVVVVLLQTMKLQNDNGVFEALSSLYQTSNSIIIALDSSFEGISDHEENAFIDKLEATAEHARRNFNYVELTAERHYRGMDEISKEIRSAIVNCFKKDKCSQLSKVSRVLEQLKIPCDSTLKECTEGSRRADDLCKKIDPRSANIHQLWIELSNLTKKKYKAKTLQQKTDIEMDILQIRTQQHGYIAHLHNMTLTMIQNLNDLKDFPDKLLFFLKSLKLSLDKRSKRILPGLLARYNDLSIASKTAGRRKDDLERQIKKLKIEIEEASFGVEHLMREVAQIFEAGQYFEHSKNLNVLECVNNCPSIAANLLLQGYPLEIVDGAASDVPLVWMKHVFRCLESKIGSNSKILTLSIMGIQSSGKSTLLNAMFGLQLAVSTGRCTKGVFLQLIPMPKNKFPFQYVLVFDTEGLRSNEYRESNVTYEHDNQLATFVVGIGDITIINIRGENLSEVSDILEIVVHAFIRIKKVHENFELKQSCIFVHQDVADSNAKSKMLPGTLQLVKCLDEKTTDAAEQENLPNCHFFDNIIYFKHEKHVFYFPNLWRGTPPFSAINTEYSESVDELRQFIMSDISTRRSTYFSVTEIWTKINDLWEAVLSEDFIFSFRNGIELKAERKAESKFFELRRKLENTVSKFLLMEAESDFGDCENEEDLKKVKSKVIDKLNTNLSSDHEKLQKNWCDFIEDEPLKDILIQWKENRLNQLKLHKEDQAVFALKEISKIESKMRIEIRQKIVLTPNEQETWKHKATTIAEKCLEHPLDREIIADFEILWKADLGRLKTETTETFSINEEIWKIVQDYLQIDSIYLKKEKEIFIEQQREKQFKLMKKMQGCIIEGHLTERYLSGKGCKNERKISLKMANDIFLEIDKFLRNRKDNKFSIIEIRQIFDNILKAFRKCDEDSTRYSFTLSNNFKAMLAVCIWKYLCVFFQKVHDKYEKAFGLEAKRMAYKTTLLNNFRKLVSEAMKLKKEKIQKMIDDEKTRKENEQREIERQNQVREQDRKVALLITDIVEKRIISHVSICIQEKIVDKILRDFDYAKHNLIKYMLQSLAGNEDFNDFDLYLNSTTSYVNTYIKTYIDDTLFNTDGLYVDFASNEVKSMISDTETAVRNINSLNISDLDTWATILCQKLHFIRLKDLSNVKCINVNNFDNLTNFIISNLKQDKTNSCIYHFRGISRYSVEWDNYTPYQKVFDKLWGCEEKCPFCFEPCQQTTKYHNDLHHCLQHRPIGVSGFRWENTNIISLGTCGANVATDDTFKCNSGRLSCAQSELHVTHKYRDYKTFAPTWNIKSDPDMSSSIYWAWFVCRFKEEISSRYNLKYPQLDYTWTSISRCQAIQSLG